MLKILKLISQSTLRPSTAVELVIFKQSDGRELIDREYIIALQLASRPIP